MGDVRFDGSIDVSHQRGRYRRIELITRPISPRDAVGAPIGWFKSVGARFWQALRNRSGTGFDVRRSLGDRLHNFCRGHGAAFLHFRNEPGTDDREYRD